MMQKLHSQKVSLKNILFVSLLLLLATPSRSQITEEVVNSEYREIILQQLQKNVEKRERAMQGKAERYLLSLPNNRKLYDESKVNIQANLISGVDSDGHAELNYHIAIDYACRHSESGSDNYPAGQYLCESSNASLAICELTRMMIDDLSQDAFKNGKLVTIKIKASTDITEVTHLDYGGEYGDFQYEASRYNDEPVRITISQESGITSNAQLAFLRAQGIKHRITNDVNLLRNTQNEYLYHTLSYSQTGAQYRNVGIDITVHGAFNEEIVEMNERLINDEFVDYNIPKNEENSNQTTYFLILANEHYGVPLPDVPFAYNDGEILSQYCVRTLGIPSRHVKLIEDATMNDIKVEGVKWMKEIALAQKGNCNFVIYFVGHGFTDVDNNPYIAPAGLDYKGIRAFNSRNGIDIESRMSGTDVKKLLNQCLRVDTLCTWFNRVPMKSMTIILDASFNGTGRDGQQIINMKHNTERRSKGLRIRNDVVVWAAAPYEKTAFSFDEQHHGFFTYYMLKELKKRKGNIDYEELFNAINSEVQRESALQGKLQEPTVTVGGKLKETWGSLRFM